MKRDVKRALKLLLFTVMNGLPHRWWKASPLISPATASPLVGGPVALKDYTLVMAILDIKALLNTMDEFRLLVWDLDVKIQIIEQLRLIRHLKTKHVNYIAKKFESMRSKVSESPKRDLTNLLIKLNSYTLTPRET